MFRRDTKFRVSETTGSAVYGKSLLLKISFVISNDFWISNDDFGFKSVRKDVLS